MEKRADKSSRLVSFLESDLNRVGQVHPNKLGYEPN